MELNQESSAAQGLYGNAWVVLGLEGTGSKFIAKTMSYVLGKCNHFGEWDGSAYNANIYGENIILHRSLPYMRPKKSWVDLEIELVPLRHYYRNINFIVTTRDLSCSINSKASRFGDSIQEAMQDYSDNIEYLKSLVSSEKHLFIWSYETMVAYGDVYFQMMYKYFAVDSNFTPAYTNQNLKYIMHGDC
jgi:hypothetical protein